MSELQETRLLAGLVPGCGRWGAVWGWEQPLPKGAFGGRGGAQEEHVGRGFLGTRGLRACLEETRQVRCLPTGSLRRAGNL